MLGGLDKSPGARTDLTSCHAGTRLDEAITDAGIGRRSAYRYKEIAKVPEADFEQHIAEVKDKGGELTSAGVRRLVRAEHVKDIASGVRKQIAKVSGVGL